VASIVSSSQDRKYSSAAADRIVTATGCLRLTTSRISASSRGHSVDDNEPRSRRPRRRSTSGSRPGQARRREVIQERLIPREGDLLEAPTSAAQQIDLRWARNLETVRLSGVLGATEIEHQCERSRSPHAFHVAQAQGVRPTASGRMRRTEACESRSLATAAWLVAMPTWFVARARRGSQLSPNSGGRQRSAAWRR